MPMAPAAIGAMVAERAAARGLGDWTEADRLLASLRAGGVAVEDRADGTSGWRLAAAEPVAAAASAVPSAAGRREKPAQSVRAARGRKGRAHRRAQKPRAAAFADWLCAAFPLADGEGGAPAVLDVAGGRGELCWELAVGRGIGCVVVDPQPVRLSREKTKRALGLAATAAAAVSSGRAKDAQQPSGDGGSSHAVPAEWLDARVLAERRAGGGGGDPLSGAAAAGAAGAVTAAAACSFLGQRLGMGQLRMLFAADFGSPPQAPPQPQQREPHEHTPNIMGAAAGSGSELQKKRGREPPACADGAKVRIVF